MMSLSVLAAAMIVAQPSAPLQRGTTDDGQQIVGDHAYTAFDGALVVDGKTYPEARGRVLNLYTPNTVADDAYFEVYDTAEEPAGKTTTFKCVNWDDPNDNEVLYVHEQSAALRTFENQNGTRREVPSEAGAVPPLVPSTSALYAIEKTGSGEVLTSLSCTRGLRRVAVPEGWSLIRQSGGALPAFPQRIAKTERALVVKLADRRKDSAYGLLDLRDGSVTTIAPGRIGSQVSGLEQEIGWLGTPDDILVAYMTRGNRKAILLDPQTGERRIASSFITGFNDGMRFYMQDGVPVVSTVMHTVRDPKARWDDLKVYDK